MQMGCQATPLDPLHKQLRLESVLAEGAQMLRKQGAVGWSGRAVSPKEKWPMVCTETRTTTLLHP